MMKGIRVWALILFIFLYPIPYTLYPVQAVESYYPTLDGDIGYSKIHPASPFYFLKAVRENIELGLAGTPRTKMLRTLEFAIRRLRETRTLLTINQDLIPPTLEKYTALINSLTDKHQTDDEFAIILKNNLVIHLKFLEEIYNQTLDIKAKMFIRSTMNRLIQRADTPNYARIPICILFSKEATSASLNQTEQIVLLERAQKCLKINR